MSEHRLSEIVIERPRHGMRRSSRRLKGVRKSLDRLTQEASDDGLLSPYLLKTRAKTKYLSDHLGPLRRLLRSKVNQPWDEVYQVLCQRLDSSTLTGLHVRSHLWDYVERYVEIIDGVPYRKTREYFGSRRIVSRYRDAFYIHPETGLLCLAERVPKPAIPKRNDIVDIDGTHQYRKLNEVWYVVIFADLPHWGMVWDVVLKINITPDIAYREYGRKIYASQKIQCDKRLLKVVRASLSHT